MSDDDPRKELLERRQIYQRNLAILQKQAAGFGHLNVPVGIINQISECKAEIIQLDRQLNALAPVIDDELRTQAFIAFTLAEAEDFRGDLSNVANLLTQIVKADPNDETSHEQLKIIRQHHQFQRDYAAIAPVRATGNWKAVELLLTKLAQRAPNFTDPEQHWAWVREAKQPKVAPEPVQLPKISPVPTQIPKPKIVVQPKYDYPANLKAYVELLQNPDPSIPLQKRLEAAEKLAKLGDPRPGVCNLDIDWCEVPTDAYTIGEGQEQQKIRLPAFRISKYCVTNAQWKLFMDAGGYMERRWWGEYWQYCQENQWIQPRYWNNDKFNAPNQPVVGISWYEASAFCQWLTEKLGYQVMLPTQAQWEVAARGPQGLIYPWGNQWNANYANTYETKLERTTPVGCYPHGASWCGALDLAGNVWEWTASDIDNPDRTNKIDIMNNSTHVSIRGGSWIINPLNARVASRYWLFPHGRDNAPGLRLFRSSSQT